MSSLTRRGERLTASTRNWTSQVQHPSEFSLRNKEESFHPRERPAPEGSRDDPLRTSMCHRADVPSCKSLSGSIGDRIMSFGTLCRGSVHPGRSERKVTCCENCSATLVALKKQALSLAVHHHFSSKDSSDLSAYLHDNLRVHTRFNSESREQGDCGACGTNLNKLKREAVHVALSRGQSAGPFDSNHIPAKHGDKAPRETVHAPHGRTHSPYNSKSAPQSPKTPQRTPQTLRRRVTKPEMDRWVEEQLQLVSSKPVTINHHHQAAEDSMMGGVGAGVVQTNSKIPHISRVVNIANTAAMSFLARAAEKLNLTRKKGQASEAAPAHFPTCFREIIQKNPPPVPPCLIQAATRTRDSPDISKVRVVLRVNPTFLEAPGHPPVLRIDSSKKRVIVMEPGSQSLHLSTMTLGREGRSLLKSFSFDAAYSQDTNQTEVCAGVLADVIRCVLSGTDACVLGLGCADVGSWTSMVGSDESLQKLGLIPTAISWLYAAVERRREKTWTDLSVSVSAIELCCGEEDTLRDLLGEIVPSSSSFQGSPTHAKLQDDSGMQIRHHNRVKAPNAERAASLLDAAIAARRHNDFTTFLSHTSIMFFTLHVHPPRTESSTIGKGSRGPTKLTIIDVCTGMGGLTGYYKNKPPHSELGPIVLSLLSGHRTIPKKSSKLSMLLRDSLGSASCHTTVIAQVTNSLEHLQDTFSIIHLASRIRRVQKKTKPSSSCSPRGRSLTREKRGPQPFSLRAFHSTDEVDVDVCKFRLRGELDEHSSSDQSCDTVIQIDSKGLINNKAPPRTTQPKFVPIIPSLHPSKADMDDPEFTALLQELLRIPKLQVERKKEDILQTQVDQSKAEPKPTERDCLKCDTFAELQERLGCIDGKEATVELAKVAPCNNHSAKSQTPSEPLKQKASDSLDAPQRLVNQRSSCSQPCAGESQTDGTIPGDSFQREDSGLYDCEECSATSSSEEVMNQPVSSHAEPPNRNAPDFPTNASRANSSHPPNRKQKYQELNDWFRSDERASPVGKSSPISPPFSCSASQPLATSVIIGDELPKRPKENVKEVKATITVTVQQPLDLKGQDELVYSMVEEVTISGAVNASRTGGNIICIRDNAQSPVHLEGQSSSQPIRIISNITDDSSVTEMSHTTTNSTNTTETVAEKSPNSHQGKREKTLLPSFINPMLIHSDMPCDLVENDNASAPSTGVQLRSDPRGSIVNSPDDNRGIPRNEASASHMYNKKSCKKTSNSAFGQNLCDTLILEDSAFCDETAQKKESWESPHNTRDRSQSRDRDVDSNKIQRGPLAEDFSCRRVGNNVLIGVSHGCQETGYPSLKTGSLPRGLQNTNCQEHLQGGHMAEDHRDQRGGASSSHCTSGAPLESQHCRQHSQMTHHLQNSSAVKYKREYRQETSSLPRKGVGSLCDISGISMKHDLMSGRPMSPKEDCSRLFNTKLSQLVSNTNSLGRIPKDFPAMERGRSKGSLEWICERGHKGGSEGDCTLQRASRSPKKDSRNHHKYVNAESSSSKHGHSKLSAVGKLKMAGPKVRRLSAPSIKNLSLPHRRVQQSINRSASLSPDSRTIERSSTCLSSSPPRSHHSLSRTPSQSSTSSSTKSAIQGFANGLISDFFKENAASPTLGGSDQTFAVPSPYSQLTSPRTPTHMSGHASDTTSVLSGDLPPAMGKTSLHFSHRNSTMSSGYSSMFRESEATGSGASLRDSVSDRSGSPGSSIRSRSSRSRGDTGTHQRRLSNDTPPSLRRSGSGLRSYSVDPDIPEAYEITLYEIDEVQRAQKKAGRTLQRQADVFGGLSAEDVRILQPDERRGAFNVNPRLRTDFHSGHRGASGSQ